MNIGLLIISLIVLIIPNFIFSASLYFSPSLKEINVGQNFTIDIYVESNNQPINAVSAEISWPTNLIKLVNFPKSGSIFNFWVKEPTIVGDKITFEGVIFNPGFQGNKGKLLTLNFKAIGEGSGEVKFVSGMILANDGEGTNILTSMRSANISVIKKEIVEEQSLLEKPVVTKISPPLILSPTHPDQNKWYNNSSPIFEWVLPNNVLGVKTGYGKDSDLVPTVNYSPPITKKQLENIPDGSYYFAIQFVGEETTSKVQRFKFNIDTQSPQFREFYLNRVDQTSLIIKLKADDELSGISSIKIYLDGQLIKEIKQATEYEDILKNLTSGSHLVKVEIFDRANNKNEKIEEVIITKPIEVIVEKDYSLYFLLIAIIFILIIVLLFLYFNKNKLEIVRQEIRSQRLEHLGKDLHVYITNFLKKAKEDLSLLDNQPGLSDEEKNLYLKIREILSEAELKIKDILRQLRK